MDNRIKHALYLHGWSYAPGDKATLRKNAEKILINEYLPHMKGHVFCPECSANLFRSPEDKDYASNGRVAYFAHSRGIDTDCGLRTRRAEGKKYLTEEEAKKAIKDEELVIVKGFIKEKPIPPDRETGDYDVSPIEEQDGPISRIPIGRHRGDTFSLPSKFKTIRGICNKFDENLVRYFFMPGGQHAIQLQDLLRNVEDVTGTDGISRIYYGRIVRLFSTGRSPRATRMTRLEFESEEFADFSLKVSDELQREKGIDDNAVGRVVLVYGNVTTNGIGLCIGGVGWGEFALLPSKYERLLYHGT